MIEIIALIISIMALVISFYILLFDRVRLKIKFIIKAKEMLKIVKVSKNWMLYHYILVKKGNH
ncbi:MAG: hypothetical protein N2V75_06605 [Methanophagales archaeon]|nr:hypothetical protein [Methanophagales archaeon]